jgi:hypothetical protein
MRARPMPRWKSSNDTTCVPSRFGWTRVASEAGGPHHRGRQILTIRPRSSPDSGNVVGEELARRACGRVERVVPRGEEHVVAEQLQGACQVDSVVAAQGMLRGEVAGVAGESVVDSEGAQLGAEIVERGNRADVRRFADTAAAGSRGERRACLGVDELAGGQEVGPIPEFDGELGAGLVEDQLDECRCVEVDDQRRWSATRSDTGFVAVSRAPRARGVRGSVGSRTSPRARRSASGSTSSTGTRRATRRPRIVTTTSPPSLTCWT